MRKRLTAIVVIAAVALLAVVIAGCSLAGANGPKPGVSMTTEVRPGDVPYPAIAAWAAEPGIVRTATQTLDVSKTSSASAAKGMAKYAETLGTCTKAVEINGGQKTEHEVALTGKLLIVHATSHEQATRLRLKDASGKEIALTRISADSSALDMYVEDGAGVSGKVTLFTESDPKRMLADTAPRPVGSLFLYTTK